MEAFTNHQVFSYTMSGLMRNGMLCSEFFAPLKKLNLTVLKPFYGIISKAINPFTDGKATQRANTYTYRTPHYMMATTQKYLPGGFSDQQHIWNCLLSSDVCVFATHPSGELQEKGALSKSPGYWVGNGRNPHAVQFENRIMAIYHIPEKKAAFESSISRFTHAYFPFDKFDRTVLLDNRVFGKLGATYVALISATPLERVGVDELKQYGDKQFWICECSSSNVERFDEFIARCTSRAIHFDGDRLAYGNFVLNYKGVFTVNNAVQDTSYMRYDSEYCRAKRDTDCYVYEFNGERLEVRL
jgi:hypothetical protein